MQNLQKIKRCLISVSDKSGIVELSKYLASQGVEIISTGGTCKLLAQNQIAVKDISDFTGFPEMMDGRVKTLHPKVHGALLAVLDNPEHVAAAQEHGIDLSTSYMVGDSGSDTGAAKAADKLRRHRCCQ